MMDQTFMPLPFRRHGEAKFVQFFRRFFLSQPRVLARFLRPGLESLLVFQILPISLQLARDLRDPILGASDLLLERSFLGLDLGQSPFLVSDGALGGKNLGAGLRRFFVRALVISARFRDGRLGGVDLILRLVARQDCPGSFRFEPLRFMIEAGDDCFASKHRIGGGVDSSTENDPFRRNELTAERRKCNIARRLFQFQAGGEIGYNRNFAQKICDERCEFRRRVYFVYRPRDRTFGRGDTARSPVAAERLAMASAAWPNF